jgi:hypothetical protein
VSAILYGILHHGPIGYIARGKPSCDWWKFRRESQFWEKCYQYGRRKSKKIPVFLLSLELAQFDTPC